jgi:EAL domain-containing protein (putative c-di-GMP-specific phosphodiesterase class I)
VHGDQVIYRFVMNDDGSDSTGSMQIEMDENLLQGVERGEFRVYYQPIISLPDGRISAVEALLRWQHPERGLVSAAEFIFAAERSGLIDRLGEWMIQVACTQLAQWQKAGKSLKLAVNLSERQLENNPAGLIAGALQKAGMEPHTLQIEIPAAALIQNNPVVIENLRKLSLLGVQISVDGFSGQSPLSALENFQVNSVKIDRSLVGGIGDPENAATVSGMISAIQRLGLNVVGEGVETQQQLDFLQEQLCTLAQGYLFGRPVPADEVTVLLKKRRTKKDTG